MDAEYSAQSKVNNEPFLVKTDNFEGPFDLLLYLVRNSKINIHELSISEITRQFLDSIAIYEKNLEISSEFIFMAAHLLYLKSRILIPQEIEIEDEMDERKEFIANLIEYQKYKNASRELRRRLDTERVLIRRNPQLIFDFKDTENWVEISIIDLIMAFSRVAKGINGSAFTTVALEEISIEDKIDEILNYLIDNPEIMFEALFSSSFSKYELIITFLALLELVKMKKIHIMQHKLFGSIKILRREEM
ncbi:MAG: segregation and condensation protein A [Spirochaetota bacterium]